MIAADYSVEMPTTGWLDQSDASMVVEYTYCRHCPEQSHAGGGMRHANDLPMDPESSLAGSLEK
jgi:hypothetical protein